MSYKDAVLATSPSRLSVFYMFDELSGTQATDSSANANHATYVSNDHFDLKLGRPPIVDGAAASVVFNPKEVSPLANRGYVYNDDITFFNQNTKKFTVIFWLDEFRSREPGNQVFFDYTLAGTNNELLFRLNSTGGFEYAQQGSGALGIGAVGSWPANTYYGNGRHMYCIQGVVGGANFYIDGVIAGFDVFTPGADHAIESGSLTIGNTQSAYQTPSTFDPVFANMQAFSMWDEDIGTQAIGDLWDAGKNQLTPYELFEAPVPIDQLVPVVDNFTPAGALDDLATVGFDVTDWAVGGAALKVKVWVNYPDGGQAGQFELVENNGVADDRYTVTRNTVSDTVSYTLVRKDGWPSSPFTVLVEVDDQKNAIVSATSPEYTVPEQEYPPNMRPKYNLQKRVLV